jgi:hypothetical protein
MVRWERERIQICGFINNRAPWAGCCNVVTYMIYAVALRFPLLRLCYVQIPLDSTHPSVVFGQF